MSLPRCVNCGADVNQRSLVRVNAIGEVPAVWGCLVCVDDGLVNPLEPVDSETRDIVDAIEEHNRGQS